MWIKWTDCIVVGTGDYEAPEMKDVKTDVFSDIENNWAKDSIMEIFKQLITYMWGNF
jgi:hypothetical protein